MQEQIVHKSTEMFLKLGFKTVTMDDIALEMGISKKTIYKYFANKEELIEACIRAKNVLISAGMQQVSKQQFNPVEEHFQLKKFFDDMFKTVVSSPLYQLKRHYPQVYDKIIHTEILGSCRDFFEQNIERGKATGYYRPDIITAHYVMFYYNCLFCINESHALEQDITVLETSLLEYHLRAMVTPKGLAELERIRSQSYHHASSISS